MLGIGGKGGKGEFSRFSGFFDFFVGFWGSGGVPGGSWRPGLHFDKVWAQTEAHGPHSYQIS